MMVLYNILNISATTNQLIIRNQLKTYKEKSFSISQTAYFFPWNSEALTKVSKDYCGIPKVKSEVCWQLHSANVSVPLTVYKEGLN